jgi:cytochrome c553
VRTASNNFDKPRFWRYTHLHIRNSESFFRGGEYMGTKSSFLPVFLFVSLVAFCLVFSFAVPTASAAGVTNTCIECHGDPDLRVTNKKLYKYFREWELSIHAVEEVTCADCHGGNPDKTDMNEAHGKDIRQMLQSVEYEQISTTCGRCHKENAVKYKETKHYRMLTAKAGRRITPNCVTCHGSINTSVPTSDEIRKMCSHCHNAVTENHPEIPEMASYLVDRLYFINSQYRYLISKGVLKRSPDFSTTIDNELSELAHVWHSLDMDRIEEKTLQIRSLMMKKGRELRKERQQAE